MFPDAAHAREDSEHASALPRLLQLPDGPPQTSHELNGWGDDMVHDYLRGIDHRRPLGVLYSNKDYGCEWDYDWRNKRFQRDDNTSSPSTSSSTR